MLEQCLSEISGARVALYRGPSFSMERKDSVIIGPGGGRGGTLK